MRDSDGPRHKFRLMDGRKDVRFKELSCGKVTLRLLKREEVERSAILVSDSVLHLLGTCSAVLLADTSH